MSPIPIHRMLIQSGALSCIPIFVALCSMAASAEPLGEGQPSLAGPRLVLRVSEAALEAAIRNKRIDRQTPIQDVILGTTISGTTQVVGTLAVQLADNPTVASFALIFRGTARSRTIGTNGPAIIYSRATTTFSATKQIVFEPGVGFRSSPSTIEASTVTTVEGIGSTRKGLIGCIVRRRAAKIEAAQHAEVTEIARQKTAQRIVAAFDTASDERLAEFKWVSEFRSVAWAALGAGSSTPPLVTCSTTPGYVQIAMQATGERSPVDLPEIASASVAGLEIWIHDSLLGGGRAAALDLLGDHIKLGDLIKVVSAAAQLAGASDGVGADPVSAAAEQRFHGLKAGNWRVLQWELPETGATLLAEATPQTNSQPISPLRLREPRDVRKPRAVPEHRVWTSGRFTAEAEFLALEGNMVRLRRTTGIRTSIPFAKLSALDQAWIRAYLDGR